MRIRNDSVDSSLSCKARRRNGILRSAGAARKALSALILTGILCVSGACGRPTATTQGEATTSPTVTDSAADVSTTEIRLAAGWEHTCALTAAGGMSCWGDNSFGQLGNGVEPDDFMDEMPDSRIAVEVTDLTRGATSISAGGGQTCAILESGVVQCWGSYVPVGGDGSIPEYHHSPVDMLDASEEVSALSIGGQHACVLTHAGAVKCWGKNSKGQLGDGTKNDSDSFVAVTGLSSGIVAVSAGYEHTCALSASGGVKCWGGNERGVLGNGDKRDSNNPVDVTGLTSGVVALSARGAHACVLTQAAGVKCWGFNRYGQLGDGTTDDSTIPVEPLGLNSGVSGIFAAYHQTCALTVEGAVKCWGRNEQGQLGDGTTKDRSTPPDAFSISSGVVEIAIGNNHACALTIAGAVKCWGENSEGQLGNGKASNSRKPVDVVGLDTPLATWSQYALLVAPYGGIVEELGKLGSSECDWSTPGRVERVPSEPFCMMAATTAQVQAQAMVITLENAQTVGSSTFIGRPPKEMERLVAETTQASKYLAGAWAEAEPCMTAPGAGCDARFLKFLSSRVDLLRQFKSWKKYGINRSE